MTGALVAYHSGRYHASRAKTPRIHQVHKETDPQEHIAEFQSKMSFHQPHIMVYYMAFPSSLAGPALKSFNPLPIGCITSFEEIKNQFPKTYVRRIQQDEDEHSLMTIKQRETESIASIQERFQSEFNLIPGANKKIDAITFVEGLRLTKFKESVLKR
ncbi:hypothetical protein LIER_12240 [Lithospermum erythrorhizon]|uniref:Retrotransposon gag domain-containing protein n=1 Tax=Lithospermum erythrorhizon TaxID=34254 RepID=A0AAV3PSZ4_LITER